MDMLLPYIFVFACGACIGSFLNVVALRALTNESIVLPSSKCPKCSSPIKWYDNIPIFSYFFTFKGKCRNCNESVSKQYPIVEFLTALIFLVVYIAFGFTIKSLLLLILMCIAIVIIITDIKQEYVFESHAWGFIIFSFLTSFYLNDGNYIKPAIGLIVGFILMEIIAKVSYYLIRKNPECQSDITSPDNNSEKFDINEYIKTNKRAFGEGDTYLACAIGALVGWQYLFLAIFVSIVLQALCIIPNFIKDLYNQNQKRLIFSLTAFIILSCSYWIISNISEINFYVMILFIAVLLFFAIDTIQRLKQTVIKNGFTAIAFGPSLIVSGFIILFFGQNIAGFLFKHIFI